MCTVEGDTLYLGNRRIKGKGFTSGYGDTLPPRIPEAELPILVQKLVDGDRSAAEPIILGHLALTVQIVGRYVSYFHKKSEDLMGVAQLELTEATYRFIQKHKDLKITPYLIASIHGKLAEFIRQEDRLIRVTKHGMAEITKKSKAENTSVESNVGTFISLTLILDDKMDMFYKDNIRYSKYLSYSDDHPFELQEIIDKCNLTRLENMVYTKLMRGDTEAEIARELKFSRETIRANKQKVVNKLMKHIVPFEERIKLKGRWFE